MNKKVLFISIFLASLFLFPLSVHAHLNLATNFYVESGKKFFDQKNYDQAIKEFNKALLADPDNEEALMYLRMLGFGGNKNKDTAANREQGESPKQEVADKKISAGKVQKQNIKSENIKAQNAKEEKAALQALRADAALKETIALRENQEQQKNKAPKNSKDSKKNNKEQSAHQAEKITAVKKASPKPAVNSIEKAAEKPVEPSIVAPEMKSESQETIDEPKPVAKSIKKSIEKTTEPLVVAPAVESESFENVDEPKPALVKNNDDQVQVEAVEPPVQEKVLEPPPPVAPIKKSLTAKQQETALVKKLNAQSQKEQANIRQKFADEESKKILQLHVKYKSKGIGPKEKYVFRDLNGDGTPEKISLAESKAIEQVQKRTDKEEKVALKISVKKAAEKEKVALTKLRNDLAKVKDVPVQKKTDSVYKAGDIVTEEHVVDEAKASFEENEKSDQDDIQMPVAKDTAPSVKPQVSKKEKAPVKAAPIKNAKVAKTPAKQVSAHQADETIASTSVDQEEVPSVKQIREDLAKKEKVLHEEFAQKQAVQLAQLKKISSDMDTAIIETKDAPTKIDVEVEQLNNVPEENKNLEQVVAANPVVAKVVAQVKTENVVLKKKLEQVVEMSTQDQKTIKDLESHSQEQSKKAEVLETNLAEVKETLESKKEVYQQQTEKLKDLQTRINAMELDVHSKQYDFKDKQLEYDKKLQAIEQEFGNYKTEKAKSEEELKDQLRILKEALTRKIAELNEAQEKLLFTENKLQKSEEKHAETIKQYEGVKKTLADLEGRLAGLQTETKPEATKTDTMPVVAVDPKNLPAPKNQQEAMYQQWIQRHDKLVSRLKEKLLWARDQMDYLGRYDIKLSDQKMAALKEQLVAIKKQLGTTGLSSTSKAEDFTVMEARLKDAQERLGMVEKILSEKDEQIKELEKQLNGVLSAF